MDIETAVRIVEARYPDAIRTVYPDLISWDINGKDFALAYQDGVEHLMPLSNSVEDIADCDIFTHLDLTLCLDYLD